MDEQLKAELLEFLWEKLYNYFVISNKPGLGITETIGDVTEVQR